MFTEEWMREAWLSPADEWPRAKRPWACRYRDKSVANRGLSVEHSLLPYLCARFSSFALHTWGINSRDMQSVTHQPARQQIQIRAARVVIPAPLTGLQHTEEEWSGWKLSFKVSNNVTRDCVWRTRRGGQERVGGQPCSLCQQRPQGPTDGRLSACLDFKKTMKVFQFRKQE